MIARSLLLLSALALTSCEHFICITYGCQNGFSWQAPLPPAWTGEEVEEGGIVRLCVNGECEERPFWFGGGGHVVDESDGSVSISVYWEVEPGVPLVDGDRVSLALLAPDGTPIAALDEEPVTYTITAERVCDIGTCRHVELEGSTL